MPWLDWLRANIGKIEWTGKMPSDFVRMLFREHTSFGDPGDVTPPCCAATLCAALELTGFKSPHRADAISFVDYGIACIPKPGAICVFEWSPGEHHVSVYDHAVDIYRSAFTGGNQNHFLQTSVYPLKPIIASRWPVHGH